MNVRLLLLVFLLLGFTAHRAHAQPVQATFGSFSHMWDSTFRVSEQNLPLTGVPAGITTPAFQRMWVLLRPKLASFTTDASFSKPIHYGAFRDLVGDLALPAVRRDFFDKTAKMIAEFKRYGIPPLDSLEAVARGRSSFVIDASDTVSQSVIDAIALAAPSTPIVILPSIETTVGDTVLGSVMILSNTISIWSWKTTFSSDVGFAHTDTAFGSNGFSASIRQVDDSPESYTVGGLNAGGVSLSDFELATFPVAPSIARSFAVFEENASIADSLTDFLAWPHMGRYKSYSRFDMNQDDTITIADASRAALFVLRGFTPPLPHLGDVNGNGILDPDDPFLILEEALFGDGVPRIVPRARAVTRAAHGVLEVATLEDTTSGTVSVSLRFKSGGDLGDARRLACIVRFNADAFSLSDLAFETQAIPSISGTHVEGGAARVLLYPQAVRPGAFLAVKLARRSAGSPELAVEPLVGDNFFSFGEDVKVEYLVSAPGENGTLPDQFELGQNYPNPFNPGTTIEYAVPQAGTVDLTVYNILGQPVRTLVHRERAAGRYSITFDGSDNDGKKLSSGTYFYRIIAGDYKATKRMTLIR